MFPESPLLVIDHSLCVFEHDHLKPVHSEVVQVLLQSLDIFVTILTGCGKSLIYQVLQSSCLSSPFPIDQQLLSVQIHVNRTTADSSLPPFQPTYSGVKW